MAGRVRDRRVLVFKPGFGVATSWAYQEMASEAADAYMPAAVAEARWHGWLDDPGRPLDALLMNNMERAVFRKFLAIPTLLQRLRDEFGLGGRMSGSGSACFALLPDSAPMPEISSVIREMWGPSATVRETRFA